MRLFKDRGADAYQCYGDEHNGNNSIDPFETLHAKAGRELLDDIGEDDPPQEAPDTDTRHSDKELNELELHSSDKFEACV